MKLNLADSQGRVKARACDIDGEDHSVAMPAQGNTSTENWWPKGEEARLHGIC